jgi:2-succinyl-5-enolpyruvyl-6-hydroxy-3-cyclohexene-1-carboxylate synthase
MRGYLRAVKNNFKHWAIEESGYVKDPFMRLTDIFECTPDYFFKSFSENSPINCNNDRVFYNMWKNLLAKVEIPELPFCNIYASQQLSKYIPNNSLLHLGIMSSTRHMHFFDLDKSIEVYSNLGALGIDGSMSTFVGQAAVSSQLCFLMLGDLSFFYDMNAARIKSLGNNIRILLVNNGGASEFHFYIGSESIPSIDDYISVKHNSEAKGWLESCGFKYLTASTMQEFDENITKFVASDSTQPIVFEVFTDMKNDAEITQELFNLNNKKDDISIKRGIMKNVATAVLGAKGAKKAIDIAKIIKDKR